MSQRVRAIWGSNEALDPTPLTAPLVTPDERLNTSYKRVGVEDFRTPLSLRPFPLKLSKTSMQRDGGRLTMVRTEPNPIPEDIENLAESMEDPVVLERVFSHVTKPPFQPLERIPCANVDAQTGVACPASGSHLCSSCRLVAYCTKACQVTHWKTHKIDCKNPMRDPAWRPGYVVEKRPPTFMTPAAMKDVFESQQSKFEPRTPLWGNTPAIDIVRLSKNEGDMDKCLNLAMQGARDIRHVLYTITNLPAEYSGQLNILIVEVSSMITWRNLVALLVLGVVEDHAMAADIVLHFLYSTFLPSSYCLKIQHVLTQHAEAIQTGAPIPLGKKSTLRVALPALSFQRLALAAGIRLEADEAQAEYNDIRMHPSRRDLRDRLYSGLKPSHRVAFQEYRRFGIILPFGATATHFNWSNWSLFDPGSREWLPNDFADPLQSYDPEEVIAAGKRHGTTAEDIYGCLYFYVSDLLRAFKRKVDNLELKIALHEDEDVDIRDIPSGIKEGKLSKIDIPSTMRFDRVFLSNLIDANYMGLKALRGWESLLSSTTHAVILGYFMNWVTIQPDGAAKGLGERALKTVLERSQELNASRIQQATASGDPEDLKSVVVDLSTKLDPFYENSSAFKKYLLMMGMGDICRKLGLKKREIHRVLPNRLGVPAGQPQNALPQFKNEEHFYDVTRLTSHNWSERYVEFGRA